MPSKECLSDLTAVVLCGGKGERLRPFTETLPKALVPLNGAPLLHHLLQFLSRAGVSRFVICVGYKAETIEEFLSEQRDPNVKIECVNSGDVTMTDRILDAQPYISGRALVCYGDTLANVDLRELLRQHERSGAAATLSTYPLHSPFGIVETDEHDKVKSFSEKPLLPYWINIGFLVCEPVAFKYMERGLDMISFLSALAQAGVLYTYRHKGKHLTVNTEKERVQAETDIVEFYTFPDSPTT
jgi:glucose-1-phosphate cytidylyltransferase